ncbi:MAG: hypothetical protein GX055_00145 [Desulfovibrionales bacterium]|nr:hypothetical protein [Desulfovibrionales bacterium]
MKACSLVPTCASDNFDKILPPYIETPRTLLEARLEAAGVRVSTYLRHVPMLESRRHEVTLEVLHRLAAQPGENPEQAAANGMRIVRDLLTESVIPPLAIAGPPVRRVHMRPEEMNRRPWVRTFMRIWRPAWLACANLCNRDYLLIIQYALLLAGLYAVRYANQLGW